MLKTLKRLGRELSAQRRSEESLAVVEESRPANSPVHSSQQKDVIFAGANRVFVKLASGEYLCVDTNSLDSIDYLLGWDIEVNIVPVFRRFLQPTSVVLDIGANFGFYTVVAGSVVRDQGRLYSFEANPHTFDLLSRSVYANRMIHNPRVTLLNTLVGDENKRAKLYFSPKGLGGATMFETHYWGESWGGSEGTAIELPMVTIDDTLPADLQVDLVKIDVEGYEPMVLKGMERTLARSPNIRIVVEFFEHMIDATFGAKKFADYIDSLGFRMCLIGADSSLQLLDRGVAPKGSNYCLLTRTPEDDIKRS